LTDVFYRSTIVPNYEAFRAPTGTRLDISKKVRTNVVLEKVEEAVQTVKTNL